MRRKNLYMCLRIPSGADALDAESVEKCILKRYPNINFVRISSAPIRSYVHVQQTASSLRSECLASALQSKFPSFEIEVLEDPFIVQGNKERIYGTFNRKGKSIQGPVTVPGPPQHPCAVPGDVVEEFEAADSAVDTDKMTPEELSTAFKRLKKDYDDLEKQLEAERKIPKTSINNAINNSNITIHNYGNMYLDHIKLQDWASMIDVAFHGDSDNSLLPRFPGLAYFTLLAIEKVHSVPQNDNYRAYVGHSTSKILNEQGRFQVKPLEELVREAPMHYSNLAISVSKRPLPEQKDLVPRGRDEDGVPSVAFDRKGNLYACLGIDQDNWAPMAMIPDDKLHSMRDIWNRKETAFEARELKAIRDKLFEMSKNAKNS